MLHFICLFPLGNLNNTIDVGKYLTNDIWNARVSVSPLSMDSMYSFAYIGA